MLISTDKLTLSIPMWEHFVNTNPNLFYEPFNSAWLSEWDKYQGLMAGFELDPEAIPILRHAHYWGFINALDCAT